jgi:phosphate transport system substrate-binding protein
LFSGFFILIASCSGNKNSPEQTPTKGKIKVLADESFRPVLEAEKMIFEALYKGAEVSIQYQPEVNIINSFLTDSSTELIFSGRKLSAAEKASFGPDDAPVREIHFASDAIAFITNNRFNNTLISQTQLESVLNGKLKTWKDVNPQWPDQEIILVFDQSNSSNLTSVIEKFGLKPGAVKIYAAGSNDAVADFVSEHTDALGVIGGSWLSDEESAAGRRLREKVSPLKIKDAKGNEYNPFQASIYEKENPFTRNIYLIRKEKNMGPGIGFSSFVLSDRGQRIVLKAGLMPAEMPGREIVIEKKEEEK